MSSSSCWLKIGRGGGCAVRSAGCCNCFGCCVACGNGCWRSGEGSATGCGRLVSRGVNAERKGDARGCSTTGKGTGSAGDVAAGDGRSGNIGIVGVDALGVGGLKGLARFGKGTPSAPAGEGALHC